MKVQAWVLTGVGLVVVGYASHCVLADNLCLRGPRYRQLPREALAVGDTIRLRAGGVDILTECDLAPPPVVRWESSDEGVLRVASDGLVTAVAPGTGWVIARARLAHASHRLVVKP